MSRNAAATSGFSPSRKKKRAGAPAAPCPAHSPRPENQDGARRPHREDAGRPGPEQGRRPTGRPRPARRDQAARPAAERPSPSERRSSRPAALPGCTPWRPAAQLLPPVPEETRRLLERLPEALRRVRPLSAAHRRSLPDDVAALSQLLTTERAGLQRPYWSSPAAVSAYLYYFLPWNLLRLVRLLAALPLPDPRAAAPEGGQALLLDLGSGPLTLPLALWLARPQWRSAPIQVLAVDTAAQPLDLGRDLLTALGELHGAPVWPVRVARAPLERAARAAGPLLAGGKVRPWLVSAANVLNELRFGGHGGYGAYPEDEEAEERLQGCRDERLEALLASLGPLFWERTADGPTAELEPPARAGGRNAGGRKTVGATVAAGLAAGPDLLVVEPGTRLGGGTVMRLRRLALEGGLRATAPCPHSAACPLLEERGRGWCHFTFDSGGAPAWLEQLSAQSGLAKSGLSLAPLLLTPRPAAEDAGADGSGAAAGDAAAEGNAAEPTARHSRACAAPTGAGRAAGAQPGTEAAAGATCLARVLSAPFAVPGLRGEARYACMADGLALLEDAAGLACGALTPVRVPENARRDRKSGAVILPAPQASRRDRT